MTVQIRTTHVGSLPRTDELLRANAAHAEGALDDDGLAAVVRAQTDAVVARQTDIGLSIVNDGEYGHAMTEKVDYGAWWFYTFERFSGLEVIDPERAAAARGEDVRPDSTTGVGPFHTVCPDSCCRNGAGHPGRPAHHVTDGDGSR